MTGVFRANNPLNTFLLFVYGLLLKMAWFVDPQVPTIHKLDGFLFNEVLSFIKPTLDNYPLSYAVLCYLLLFTQAVSLNQFIISRRLMQKPNYMPAMAYLLITSFFTEWNVLSAPMVINTLLIGVWAKMSNLYNNHHAKSTLYNIGLLTGICSFLYFPSLAFVLLIIFALLITRPFRIAEWLIALLGVFTTWYFLFAWLFLTDRLYSFALPGFHISYPLYAQNNTEYAGLAFLALVVLAGLWYMQREASKQVVQVRKGWLLMVLYFVVAVFILFINSSDNFEYWLLAIVPAAAFAACTYFYVRPKWIAAAIHWIMVGFVIYMQLVK